MKKGTTLLSLTILSLGVYRFSQGFLRQQVQQVTAATVAVGQPVQSVPITGGEINITVKSYPKATTIKPTTPDESSDSSESEQSRPTTQEPAGQQFGQTTTESTKRTTVIQPAAPVAPNSATDQESKQTAQPAAILAGTTNGQAAPKSKLQQKPTMSSQQATSESTTAKTKQRRDFKKHHSQVEKDIVAFQGGSGSPAPGGSGGASTHVGVIFGELAGRSLFAVRND